MVKFKAAEITFYSIAVSSAEMLCRKNLTTPTKSGVVQYSELGFSGPLLGGPLGLSGPLGQPGRVRTET
jgi:hypothetical protein